MAPTLRRLAATWREAPRRWGHQFHSICSYMAMFPPAIPNIFIRWLTSPGDFVYDPFSGRGTAPLEACLLGRYGYGSDANPLAWVLTGAKVCPPKPASLSRRLLELEKQRSVFPVDGEPDHIRMLFHERTLGELLWLKATLDLNDDTDRFLMALLLGVLHLNANSDGTPRGLTVSMPNTFSMSPNYVRNYIKREKLIRPEVDVVAALKSRVERFNGERPPVKGRAWLQNALERPSELTRAPKLVFTSPPYLHVMKYGKLNWIRLWLLGAEPKKVDQNLFSSGSLPKYLEFMKSFLANMAEIVSPKGFVCVVVGDVRRGAREGKKEINLARAIADSAIPRDLRLVGIVNDRLPIQRKVSRIWGDSKGRATRTDRILVLAARQARAGALPQIAWS